MCLVINVLKAELISRCITHSRDLYVDMSSVFNMLQPHLLRN